MEDGQALEAILMLQDQDERRKEKMHSNDRVISLSPIEGKRSVATNGLVDPRLFSGENKLHLVRDPMHSLWFFKYEMGMLPEPLKQQFTTFGRATKHAREYFKKRNIEIKEIIE